MTAPLAPLPIAPPEPPEWLVIAEGGGQVTVRFFRDGDPDLDVEKTVTVPLDGAGRRDEGLLRERIADHARAAGERMAQEAERRTAATRKPMFLGLSSSD